MHRDPLLAEIERLGPWFHSIDLGGGLRTKTASISGEPPDHPAGTWQTIRRFVPEDLSGLSVLDVGCNAGFYAVEAKRRSAARVVGVDVQRLHIRQALFVRRVLGLDIELHRRSVYNLSTRALGHFDITLALGLIYHCKHLVLALENLWQVTKGTLILETALYPPGKEPRPFEHKIGGHRRTLHSFGYLENPIDVQEAPFNWFLPSRQGLVALLRSVGFEDVEVVATQGERAVLVCRKSPMYRDSSTLGRLAAALTPVEVETRCSPRQPLRFTISAENTGAVTWLARGEGPGERGAVHLGAHLLAADETEIHWDYGRGALPGDVAPGAVVEISIELEAPAEPGRYRVEFDMVDEQLAWFEDLGSPLLEWEIQVEPGERGAPSSRAARVAPTVALRES